MKVHLMFRDRDFDSRAEPCFAQDTLTADLELEYILTEMAQGDEVIRRSSVSALFHPLLSAEEVRYRQDNMRDALRNPDTVRKLYEITVEAEKRRRNLWCWLSPSSPLSSNFSGAVELLRLYVDMLMQLRLTADHDLAGFRSEGFRNLFTMLQTELDDDYFNMVQSYLKDMKERDGVLISASLGNYLQGISYVYRRKKPEKFWRRWRFAQSFTVPPRDDAGSIDLVKRQERALNETTNALAQATDHLKGFFALLQEELAFYVGCLNLRDALRGYGMPVCIPELLPEEAEDRSFRELYDVSLALAKKEKVIGNGLEAEDKRLYLITGANQGGKSTFLRSIGQAQLMSQCGMPAGAESLSLPIRRGVYTHFKKEEDATLKSGKLDEELCRMDGLADRLGNGSLMLFNESFASTNEREGSEICCQITRALTENRVEVFSVTHLYTYAAAFLGEQSVQYLRAQRLENGTRTFRVVPGEPLRTAFGEDLYRKIFADKTEKT